MRIRRDSERGAALLVVMVSVAVLTALAANLAYESRVSLRIAANARDELRAAQLARGGVALSRLVLSFQQELDDAVKNLPMPRVQVWRMVPVGSELAAGLFGGEPAADSASPARPEGVFEARIEDEGLKVNAQLDALPGAVGPFVQAIHQLVCDPAWDPIFTREDARGQRMSREDLLVHLRDWVDDDAESSGLVASFGATSCATMLAALPFEKAFGDENQPYDRGEDRYRAKNARLDSLDELHLVAGVSDAFMAAFGDALTVYLPRDAKQNVNELDRRGLVRLAARIADPPLQPALLDPMFAERLELLVAQQTYGGLVSITPQQFGAAVAAAGVTIRQAALTGANSPFTDRSTAFRIRAAGTAGDVEKAIDAVVWLEKAQPGVPVAAPGKLVYWREE